MFTGSAEGYHKQEQLREDYKKIQNYLFRSYDKIGEGNFSKVYKGIDRKSGNNVAIKVIKYSTLTSKIAEDLLKNQVKILREMKHPSIIECLDIFTSQSNCYIVTQFCEGGDLDKLLLKKKYIDGPILSRIIYDVYKGLLYLNEMFIIHRDFKIANIFLTKQGRAKIADFGFAVKSKDPFKDISIGSPIYMSPQGMLVHQYGPKSQVWAFGIMIYELIHGQAPLCKCKTETELREKILVKPKIRQGLSDQLRYLLQMCLIIDPKQRIQMKQIANTSYMLNIFKQYQGYSIPNQLYSTYHSSNSSQSNTFNLIKDIKHYDEGVAILHYCRLVHKTCQKVPSPLFSQWLLNLSLNLHKAKPHQGNSQKIQKLVDTSKDYYIKYQKQHKQQNLIVNGEDIKKQCQKLIKISQQTSFSQIISKVNISYLSALFKETDLLIKSLNQNNIFQFSKLTQIQSFLQKMKETPNRNIANKTGFGFFQIKK